MCGYTYNFLSRDSMADKLAILSLAAEAEEMYNQIPAMPLNCDVNLYPRAFGACFAPDSEFLEVFHPPEKCSPDFEFEHR